ncbi:response regulator transcription factor [Fontisphaera persica]|uniref:response regulator n=1 Tax=Fontisphaera persica TaxID=2974023 RepID=UPI0024C0A47E|nr:response regulator transcription factor [Fontisphaera persica]WCJ57966.1 response regulator transcription factor [Fontisphaera persica]
MRRVLIVDDHVLTRLGMVHFVRHCFGQVEIGEADNAQTALQLARETAWDLIILDIDLPDRSGLDILPDLRRARPKTPILFVTGLVQEDVALHGLKGGACGFVEKGSSPEELKRALTAALNGQRYISGGMRERLAFHAIEPEESSPLDKLSEREFQVLRQLGQGHTLTEIGHNLSLSVKTISTYRQRLLEKLNLRTTADLVRYAVQKGLVK